MSLKVSEKPKQYCWKCKREVYQTVHTAATYYVDWYKSPGTNNKTICIYMSTSKYNESRIVHEFRKDEKPNKKGKILINTSQCETGNIVQGRYKTSQIFI